MLCGQRRAIRTFLFLDPVDGDRFERLVNIHGRLKESVPPGSVDIKRGRGGITDIEFIAQILLITHGKTTPGLALRQLMSDTRGVFDSFVAAGRAAPFSRKDSDKIR